MSSKHPTQALREALAQLAPLDCNLLQLRYVYGLDVATLARALGVDSSRVKRRLASARRRTLLHAQLACANGNTPIPKMSDLTEVLHQCPAPALAPPACGLSG